MDYLKIYNHLPIPIQNLLVGMYTGILYLERYKKGEYGKYYDFLVNSDSATAEDIIHYKEENIAKILDYAYKYCPYYRDSFKKANLSPKDFKCLEDLKKFPILTKEEVRKNMAGIIAEDYPKKKLIHYHTSGSTGKSLDFFWTKQNLQFYWATVWRGRHRFGIERGDLHLNFTGKIVVPFSQKKPPYWRYNPWLRQYMLNMQHISEAKVDSIANFINGAKFRFFVGYPSIIYSLASLLDEKNIKIENVPEYIFSSAEKMYDYQRESIEKVFKGSKVVEHYGFSENAACASQCNHFHYHEDWEMGHLELNNPVVSAMGQTGEILATGFHNYGMPFIRYEVGDTATFSDELCDCGLKSQVISEIEGRNEDYVITPEGAHIMRFDYLFKDTHSIKECQVVQKELGSIILRIVRRPEYNMSVEKYLEKTVHEMISPSLKVKFEYVESIPRTKAGKFKAVISEL